MARAAVPAATRRCFATSGPPSMTLPREYVLESAVSPGDSKMLPPVRGAELTDSSMSPPAPDPVAPTTRLMDPPRPEDALPVMSDTQPLLPEAVVPELRSRVPDTPAEPTLRVVRDMVPDPELILEPP